MLAQFSLGLLFVMQKPNLKFSSKLMQKRIPTLLGLLVLVVGLVAGTIIFSQGTGVFAPRAAPETTPKKVKITNITERSATISFLTDAATPGFVKYGEKEKKLNIQIGDDRDQIRGTVGDFKLHHITISGLDASKKYYFVLGTGSGSEFDNNGQPFTFTTAKKGGVASAAKTIYGSVVTKGGVPAKGAIVYAQLEGAGQMSSLVKDSGSWAIPLSNARTPDGSAYATIEDSSQLIIEVQGENSNLLSTITTSVGDFEPGGTITLGENSQALADSTSSTQITPTPPSVSTTPSATPEDSTSDQAKTSSPAASTASSPSENDGTGGESVTDESSKSAETKVSPTPASSPTPTPTIKSGGLGDLLGEDASKSAESSATPSAVVDLNKKTNQVVSTSTPKIEGKAPAKVKVQITVHSDTQIEQSVYSDKNGNFELDIAALSKQLEPGEHTVNYSYIDPDTGEEVSDTITFTVADPNATTNSNNSSDTSNQIAQGPTLTPTPTPVSYGTENPYPSGGASSSASASDSATASESALASSSATKGGISTRSALPSTESGIPVSGSIGTTLALILGGLFFIIAGVWSYWIAGELQREM